MKKAKIKFDLTSPTTDILNKDIPTLMEAARTPAEPVTSTETFQGWLSDQGLSLTGQPLSQAEFSRQYTGWLEHLVTTYRLGSDADGDGTIEVNIRQNDPTGLPGIEGLTAQQVDLLFGGTASLEVTTGNTVQERYYAGTFTWSSVAPPIYEPVVAELHVSPELMWA